MNQEKYQFHYGLHSKTQAIVLATQVCDVLGHGQNFCATNLLLETCAAETCLGTYEDPTPNGAGYGANQTDPIGFKDVVERTRPGILKLIHEQFGYQLKKLKVEDLANDALLSFIVCRLHYRLRPEPIPETIRGRAEYWKQFYNSQAGKGTVEHYLRNTEKFLYSAPAARGYDDSL